MKLNNQRPVFQLYVECERSTPPIAGVDDGIEGVLDARQALLPVAPAGSRADHCPELSVACAIEQTKYCESGYARSMASDRNVPAPMDSMYVRVLKGHARNQMSAL